MKTRFRLLYRGERDTYFCFDNVTRKRTSLQTNDRDAGLAALRHRMQPGDAVLVKASRGAELDRLVDALRSEPT